MKDEIIEGLQPLFKEAEEKGLWFYCTYQSLWFSPDELRTQQAKGSFIWGAVNWQLRDPKEHLEELINQSKGAVKQIDSLKDRMSKG